MISNKVFTSKHVNILFQLFLIQVYDVNITVLSILIYVLIQTKLRISFPG